jgi:hypothetical protein
MNILQIDVSGTILTDLAKFSPVIAVLALLVYFMYNKLDKKEEEVKQLNEAFRQSERENIKMLSELSMTLDRIVTADKSNTEAIVREVQSAKDHIVLLINHKTS